MSHVDLAEMDKIGQLFDRQKGYLEQGRSFIATNARPAGYTGLLRLLEPHYRSCYDAGTTGIGNGVLIADKCATTIRANREVYVATDREAYEKLRAKNPNLPPYTEPRGQLPAGGSRPPAGEPGLAQRVWDGTKWVTKGGKEWAGLASDANDFRARWTNTKNMNGRLDTLDKTVKDGSKLFGKDGGWKNTASDWAADPWGMVKKKVSGAAADGQARVRDRFEDGEDWDKKMADRFRTAYGETSNIGLPFGATAKQQHAVGVGLDALQKPGELVSAGDGVYKAGQSVLDEIERAQAIQRLSSAKNTGATTTWGKSTGGTW
jgi:hypothetical protein